MGARTRGNGCSQRVHTRAPPWVPGVPGTTRVLCQRPLLPSHRGHPVPMVGLVMGERAHVETVVANGSTPAPHRGYRVSPVRRGVWRVDAGLAGSCIFRACPRPAPPRAPTLNSLAKPPSSPRTPSFVSPHPDAGPRGASRAPSSTNIPHPTDTPPYNPLSSPIGVGEDEWEGLDLPDLIRYPRWGAGRGVSLRLRPGSM